MLDIKESWEFSIKHSFDGTMEELFHERFSFTKEQIIQILDLEQREHEVSLLIAFTRW